MKIAHVVSTFYPHQGGMGVVVYDEARALAQHGHSVTVFTMRYPGDVEHEERDGFSIQRLQPMVRLGDGGIVRWRSRLDNFDVVHVHVPWYGAVSGVVAECRRANKPLVATIHMTGRPQGLVKKLFKYIDEKRAMRAIFSCAKKIFVVNKNYFLHSYQGAGQVSELPNPIDTNIFTPGSVDRTIFGGLSSPGTKIILFVGNLMPIKRLDILLRALVVGESDWRVAVVGDGYAENEYKKLAEELGIARAVKFLGSVERIKLPVFYRSADVVVVPSETESFSLVAAEAMACGTSVIVSDVVGVRDRTLEGAITFAPGDARDLAEKIAMVFEHSKNGSRRIAASKIDFNLDKHIAELESVYRSVV